MEMEYDVALGIFVAVIAQSVSDLAIHERGYKDKQHSNSVTPEEIVHARQVVFGKEWDAWMYEFGINQSAIQRLYYKMIERDYHGGYSMSRLELENYMEVVKRKITRGLSPSSELRDDEELALTSLGI